MASSVKTKAASGSHNPAARQEKKKLWFGIIALGLLLLTAVGVVCGIVVLESKLFRQNERFVLKENMKVLLAIARSNEKKEELEKEDE